MALSTIDLVIVAAYFIISLIIGVAVARRAGRNVTEFFTAGGRMPWWLLGVSMVATTFSTDTPNLVTDIVREEGVAGNWRWWAFLLTGMLTVFVYAKLWKRSGVLTDIEFYELRYSGPSAAFLRGFRAVYLGLIFNVIVMASVSLAAIKISSVLLGLDPLQTILIAGIITVIYSSLGGLQGVLLTDFIQFILAMIGSIGAAIVALRHPAVGGLDGLLTHANVADKLAMVPSPDTPELFLGALAIPLLVGWWSIWYPGAEPGGGGYIVQRMLAAKDENNALGAVFFFNAAHYALRPWPWIIVALCSLVVFPNLEALEAAFPQSAGVIDNDLGYPAMLSFLPAGLMGIVITALAAAYMSTISTHLNWGASYLVHDVYRRFIRSDVSQREYVTAGRLATGILMILAGWLALELESALQSFNIILQIGAGTGLLFILRWFWWRINPISEVTAMVVSFAMALIFFGLDKAGVEIDGTYQFLGGVAITSFAWIGVTFLTRPSDMDTLLAFYRKVHPGGPGWRRVAEYARDKGEPEAVDLSWQMPTAILCIVLGAIGIYTTLFATGYWIYGRYPLALALSLIAFISIANLTVHWRKLTRVR